MKLMQRDIVIQFYDVLGRYQVGQNYGLTFPFKLEGHDRTWVYVCHDYRKGMLDSIRNEEMSGKKVVKSARLFSWNSHPRPRS
jgi:hypothetical protein